MRTGLRFSVSLGIAVLSGVLACHRGAAHREANDTSGKPAAGTSQGAARARATQIASAPAAAQRLARLEGSLRAIEDGLRDSPRDRWDPEYVVAQVGKKPRLLFEWVRDNTSWVPYRGALRGPVGVLMDRQGNSLDRALLLATLLEKAGQTVRLARGELTQEQAVALLPGLVSRRASSVAPGVPGELSGDLFRVAAEYRLDSTSLDQTTKAQQSAVGGTRNELNSRVTDQVERLLRLVPSQPGEADWTERFDRAVDALRDHWWVQYQEGENWIDLNLFEPDSGPAAAGAPATETIAVTDLPADLQHTLAVRLIVEQWSEGKLQESRALDQVLRPADFTGQPLVLQVWPGEWPKVVHPDPNSRFGLKGLALEQHRWGAALMTGDSVLAQAVFLDNGELLPAVGNPFGGLGTGIASMAQPPQAGASAGAQKQLTATWIEYELRAPGEAPRRFRRSVFDLLGPARRAAGSPMHLRINESKVLTRSLALMLRAEILPITCRVAPEFLGQLAAKSTLGNKELLRMIVRSAGSGELPPADTVLAAAAPVVSPLLSLALARLDWSPYSDRIYVDRLGLLTSHRHPGLGPNGFGLRGAIEIVAGETGITLAQPDAFVARLSQGVLDANAEALWWMGEAPLNVGEAWKASRDWTAIRPAEQNLVSSLGLPDDSRFRIAQDLKAGRIVVAPKNPVPLGSEHFGGWWRIDPATGVATGVSGTDRGQCGPEYGMTMRAVIDQAAESFAYEYVLCQEMAQAFNIFRGLMAEVQRRGYWAWWVPQIEGAADPRDVYKGSAGGCLIGAIMGGMLSTTALLPFVIRGAEGTDAAIAAGSRRTLSSLDNFRPGVTTPKPKGYPRPPTYPRPPGAYTPSGTLGEGMPRAPKTLVDEPVPPTERPPAPPRSGPLTEQQARDNLREAAAAHDAASKAATEATQDFVRYRVNKPNPARGNPGDPSKWDPELDKALQNEMWQKQQAALKTLDQLTSAQREARDAAARARGASGRGGFPSPNPPPQAPPPPQPPAFALGPTLYQIAAGSAGVAGSFYPFPWPE
jgi:hypothetical protein